jgi:hypothetical protein
MFYSSNDKSRTKKPKHQNILQNYQSKKIKLIFFLLSWQAQTPNTGELILNIDVSHVRQLELVFPPEQVLQE